MPGLISELQRDALDPNFPVDALLRRMKLCAVKLGLAKIEAWVDSELNGYTGKLPKYRQLSGQPCAWNPYNGWIPIMMASVRDTEMVSSAPVGQSIGSIRDLLENTSRDNSGSLHYPMPDSLVFLLREHMNYDTPRMIVKIGRSNLVTIVDTVRNMVLDWAIEMERKGVLGEGMSFEPTERERAQVAMSTFNIGSIGNFVGNLGNDNASRDIISSVDARSIIDIINKIRNEIPALQAAGINGATLAHSLDAIEQEASEPKPDPGKLRALLGDVRSMLVGAAGNLTAEGAIALISAATNLIG